MSNAKSLTLLFLRLSLGLLMIIWGVDKIANPVHGAGISEKFYLGMAGSRSLMPLVGVSQILLGLIVMAGVVRRYAYGALAVVTGVTLLGVWRSVLDPWGWYLGKTTVLFFPSLIIFAGVLVLMAFREEDLLVLRRKGNRN
ncbi:MAG: DoxX family membrane protein [Gemmatimonadaceae bacterium]